MNDSQGEAIKVTLIRIKVGPNLEIDLTPDEARRLYSALGEIIGPKPAEPIVNWPSPFPTHQPVWVKPNYEPWPTTWATPMGGTQNCLFVNASG